MRILKLAAWHHAKRYEARLRVHSALCIFSRWPSAWGPSGRTRKGLVLFVLAAALLQGCHSTPSTMETLSSSVSSAIKSQQLERERQNYADYVNATQRINLEREKANLPPEKIMTFKEWKGET